MDITLFNFRTFWEANADEDYREDTIRMSIALMTFLKNNNLLVDIDPFNEDGSIKEDLIIRKSNVTDEGFQLFGMLWIGVLLLKKLLFWRMD